MDRMPLAALMFMKPLALSIAAVVISITVSSTALRAADLPPAEARLIEALIDMVERLTDATFIRNGRSYEAGAAATFLRRKWQQREKDVRSAEDFIEKVASFSATTGQPYLVRFSDGREVPCSILLRAELSNLRKQE
jgi:hypothetical protein